MKDADQEAAHAAMRAITQGPAGPLELGVFAEKLARWCETLTTALPLDDWHEDDGSSLWWTFPVDEPPYVGSPLDSDWPGYHTHWTPLPLPQHPDQERP